MHPEANLAVGKYLCLVKGDWEWGVLMLALGNDDAFSIVAERTRRCFVGDRATQGGRCLVGFGRAAGRNAEKAGTVTGRALVSPGLAATFRIGEG